MVRSFLTAGATSETDRYIPGNYENINLAIVPFCMRTCGTATL